MKLYTFLESIFLATPPLPMPIRVMRFLAIGTAGLATDIAVYSVIFLFLPVAAFCRIISLVLATYVTWRLNRWATFGASAGAVHYEVLRYSAMALMAQGFNYSLFLFLRSDAPQINDQGLIVFCAALAALLSFIGQNTFTFRPGKIIGARMIDSRVSKSTLGAINIDGEADHHLRSAQE